MSNLYELTGEYLALYDFLSNRDDMSGEEITELIETSAINEQIEEKADNYAIIMKRLAVEAEGFKAKSKEVKKEADRLMDRATALENRAKRLKDNLFSTMKITGKEKFKTLLFSFGIQKNPDSVKVEDHTLFPETSKWWKPRKFSESELDKTAMKEALRAGEIIEGAELVRTESLRIR